MTDEVLDLALPEFEKPKQPGGNAVPNIASHGSRVVDPGPLRVFIFHELDTITLRPRRESSRIPHHNKQEHDYGSGKETLVVGHSERI